MSAKIPFQVGITGGIGSGKSVVARIFGLLGVPVYESDIEAKKLYLVPAIREKVVRLIGPKSYNAEGKPDTAFIAAQIYNDAVTNLTITAAPGTNSRIDRVVATVNDAYYTGLLNNVTFTVIAGTVAASPTAPATPANSISLATIAVGTSVTTIVNANITDTRTSTSTPLLTWTTALRPSSPSTGVFGFNTTLLQMEYWDGAAWQGVSGGGGGFDPFMLMGA